MTELALIVAIVAALVSGGVGFKLGMDHQQASEIDSIALAPRLLLFSDPSKSIIRLSISPCFRTSLPASSGFIFA